MVSFKLEKHPTAERLDRLRSQGIESVDDLERFDDQPKSKDLFSVSNNVGTDDTLTSHITALPAVFQVNTSPLQHSSPQPEINDTASVLSVPIVIPIANEKAVPILLPTDATTDKGTATPVAINEAYDNKVTLKEKGSLFLGLSTSAQSIYQLFQAAMQEKGRDQLRLGTKELLLKCDIKSHVTIRRAIDELIIKQVLEIIKPNQGKIPPLYRLIGNDEIEKRRRIKRLTIDEDTLFAYHKDERLWPPFGTMAGDMTQAITTPTAISTAMPTVISKAIPVTNIIAEDISVATSDSNNIQLIANRELNQATIDDNKLNSIVQSLKILEDQAEWQSKLSDYTTNQIVVGILMVYQNRDTKRAETLKISDCIKETKIYGKLLKYLPDEMVLMIVSQLIAQLNLPIEIKAITNS